MFRVSLGSRRYPVLFVILTRLYADVAIVNSHPTFSSPLSFTFLSPATAFAHPKNYSTRFCFRRLTH